MDNLWTDYGKCKVDKLLIVLYYFFEQNIAYFESSLAFSVMCA